MRSEHLPLGGQKWAPLLPSFSGGSLAPGRTPHKGEVTKRFFCSSPTLCPAMTQQIVLSERYPLEFKRI